MKLREPLLPGGADGEVAALISTLHQTEQRLAELTAGEVDTVADRDGRTLLLRRSQEQLRHSEAAKQAAILNALPAHIALLDTQGLIVSVNEAWRRFGSAGAIQAPGHGIGLNYLEICGSALGEGSAEAHQVAAGIRLVLAGGTKSFSIEYPCHSPAEQRWFQLTVTPLAGEHPSGAVIMHLNVTQRRRTQSALAQSEDGLHRAEVMAKLAHVVTGADGVFERWSETLPQLVGVEPAQLPRTTRAWLDNVHRDDQALFRARCVEAAIHQRRADLEYRLQKANGEWINVRQTMEPIKAPGEATGGLRWFNTLQDITAQRRTEENLRASESRFRQMADNISDVFYLREADGSRMLYISAAYAKIWGRSCESLYENPSSWGDAIHPDDRASTAEKNRQGLLAGKYEFEYRIVRPDGSIRWIESKGFPVRDDLGKTVRIAGVAEDITERRQAAEKLQNSEARFRSLTELSSDWFWEQDAAHRFVRFSGGDRVDGWGPDQDKAIGVARWELPDIEPLSQSWAAHKAVLEEHKPFRNFEYRRVLASGVLQYVAASGEPIFNAGGAFTGYRGVATDITERKQDELRITRLNRVYAVLSGINALIARARDRDELFREACRIAIEQGRFHMTWIGVVDRSAMQIVPVASAGAFAGLREELRDRVSLQPDSAAGYGPAGIAVREKQAVVVNDVQADPRIRHKKALADRGVRALVILPLLIADEPVAVFGMHATEAGYFDEAEMKLLRELAGNLSFALDHIEKEKKLKDSESRFRQMADSISDVFFLQNLDSSQIYYVSPAYEAIWGRTCESLYANPASWGESIHPEDLAHAVKSFTEGRNTGFDYEFRISRPDSEIRWIHVRGFPILDDAGNPYRTAGVASDITERKQAQAELEQTHSQLVEASHQRGMAEVATSVLHNVGNVLNSVNVSASLVVENVRNSRAAGLAKVAALVREHQADLGSYISGDAKGRHIPALLEQLAQDWLGQQAVVVKELDSLRANIDHIKEIVALQQGHAKVSGSAESISIKDLVEDSLRMNADSLIKHEIRIVREFEEISPVRVEKHKVLQILVNLVRNAKQACDEVRGAEKRMTLRIAQVDGRIRISVSDNGAGIAPENLTRIFAHGFTTRKDGHGFGLHSGALAATQLGGSLSAHSEGPGKGATFTLELARQSPGVGT